MMMMNGFLLLYLLILLSVRNLQLQLSRLWQNPKKAKQMKKELSLLYHVVNCDLCACSSRWHNLIIRQIISSFLLVCSRILCSVSAGALTLLLACGLHCCCCPEVFQVIPIRCDNEAKTMAIKSYYLWMTLRVMVCFRKKMLRFDLTVYRINRGESSRDSVQQQREQR